MLQNTMEKGKKKKKKKKLTDCWFAIDEKTREKNTAEGPGIKRTGLEIRPLLHNAGGLIPSEHTRLHNPSDPPCRILLNSKK